MTTTTTRPPLRRPPARPTVPEGPRDVGRRRHLLWLVAAFPFAFAVPFVLADTLELHRDVFYGVYALVVAAFVAGWARHTGLGRVAATRNAVPGAVLGVLGAAATAAIVLRTEEASDRPGALELGAALLWRGVVYGATDGVLLSVFPILAVFGAFAGTRLRARALGKLAIGAVALAASVGVTVTYHLGYSDFRSQKVARTVVGDVVWSTPTLLTLSPLGAPIAHVGLHVTAVAHSYETDLFLPPHGAAADDDEEAETAVAYLLRGERLAPVARSVDAAGPAAALRALLEGPTAGERAAGLSSAVPAGTRLRSVAVADGTATVDLGAAFAAGGGSLSMAARLAQVTYTLTRLPTVNDVSYLVEGEPLTALGGEGLIVDGPQARSRYESAAADSLEASLLGAVHVDSPAHGARVVSPVRVTGSATGTFELVLVDEGGRVLAERLVRRGAGERSPFDVTFGPAGLEGPATLAVQVDDGTVLELPLEASRSGAERRELAALVSALTEGPGRLAPGAAAYVSGPRGTWSGAAGTADLDAGRPMRAGDRFRLESVSKIWTAAVVLRLAQDGRLRPEDTVERWLPGLLPYGDRITLAQLLTHTSGLVDNNDFVGVLPDALARVGDAGLRARLEATAARAQEDPALEYPPRLWVELAAWQPLRFEPGTSTHYSNIGFEVLGLVAERAGGADIGALTRSLLIEPLGLGSAAYDPQGPIAGPHARGYRTTGRPVETTAWHGGIGAEGGIVANAADTAAFLQGLMRGRVVSAPWVARLRGDLFWRGGTQTACGVAYWHGGAGAGFRTEAMTNAAGSRVAVLLLNGRGSAVTDALGDAAIEELYCAA